MESILSSVAKPSLRQSWVRVSAWISLVWERLWPLLAIPFTLVCLILTFTWLGGWHVLQEPGLWPLLWIVRIGAVLAFAASLLPLRNLSLPSGSDITRKIEVASRLENRPITAQSDEMAMGSDDGFANVLWQAHRDRMAKKLVHLSSGTPAPDANRLDPYALRAIVPILAFAAFCYSFSAGGGQIADMYQDRENSTQTASRIDAWVNPPAYTRKSPIYLTLQQDTQTPRGVSVPQGSEFFLRFIGSGSIELVTMGAESETVISPKVPETPSPDREYAFALEEDTVVLLRRDNNVLSQWGITLLPDQPPEISFVEEPSSALSGSLQLTYSMKDDYGVVSGKAIIETVEKQDENARPLIEAPDVPLPLPRLRAKRGVSKLNKDLTKHPWAGSQVKLTLEVKDDRDQIGRTETKELTLPGRRFSNPLALALIEQRRILAMDANKRSYVANLLDAVSTAPPEFIDNAPAMIGMRVAYRRIIDARDDDTLRSALDLMWEIALGIEFGDLSDAERRLREAQEQLNEALERGASSEEIDRLMKELREAMNEMLQALAEQARNNPQAQNPFDQNNGETLSQSDLERMMDRIEDLAKSGSEDAARQLLSELQRMMDNLRAGRHEQQRQAEGNQLNQSLDELSELMQRQQELMNETFRMQRQQEQGLRPNSGEQSQRNQNGQQQGEQEGDRQNQLGQRQGQQQGNQNGQQSQSGQGGQMTQEEFEQALENLRRQQEALEQRLGELSRQLEELGLGPSDQLGQAQREMGEAGENLGRGETGGAATDQGQALEALRQGAQDMMQQMAGDRQQGGTQQSQQGGEGQAGQRRGSDPLGRQQQADGFETNSDVEIPDEIDAQRARRILEAIRKRLAIPDNPLIERDYLERLLRSE